MDNSNDRLDQKYFLAVTPMFSIDLSVKNTAMPLSVQKKEQADADTLYQEIVDAMKSGQPKLLELTCDKQQDKKITVLSEQISAVIVSQKSGITATGRPPGFFAGGETEES